MQNAARAIGGAQRGRHVAGDEQHGGSADRGLAEGGEGVDRPRTGGGQRHPESTRGARIAVRGVHARLLVAHADDPHGCFGRPEGEVVHTRQPEDDLDAVVGQELEDRRPDGACLTHTPQPPRVEGRSAEGYPTSSDRQPQATAHRLTALPP